MMSVQAQTVASFFSQFKQTQFTAVVQHLGRSARHSYGSSQAASLVPRNLRRKGPAHKGHEEGRLVYLATS